MQLAGEQINKNSAWKRGRGRNINRVAVQGRERKRKRERERGARRFIPFHISLFLSASDANLIIVSPLLSQLQLHGPSCYVKNSLSIRAPAREIGVLPPHRAALSAFHRTGSGEIGFSHLHLLYGPVVSAFEARSSPLCANSFKYRGHLTRKMLIFYNCLM
jgi:hypothetical protein